MLVVAALAAAAWSGESCAQAKVPRVGVLTLSKVALEQLGPSTFTQGLVERGWVPGRNVALEYRFARGADMRYNESAEELVRLDVDVIMAFSAPAARAAYAATTRIPIVVQDYTNDPVAAGYAESYSRPGKNVTGVFLDAPEFAGKWIELLRAIVPGLKRVAVLWDPAPGAAHLKAVQDTARLLGLQIQTHEVRTPDDLDKAFAAFRGRPQAVIILPSPMTFIHSARLADLAQKYRLPGTSIARAFAEAGGAVSYGPNIAETSERNAVQVAKILDGAKPGDLPIERPNKFDFVINMKTINTLGLKVPTSLLAGAEQVGR
jgi:putative tryptophan/tyrosine transport system substrate-binding protein